MDRSRVVTTTCLVSGGVLIGWLTSPLLQRGLKCLSALLTGRKPEIAAPPAAASAQTGPPPPLPAPSPPAARTLQLQRPFVTFDLETTGVEPRKDRIVSFAAIKQLADGSRQTKSLLVNPGIPIPEGAAAVHGIRDDQVADCPIFADIAQELLDFLSGCDLHGYNLLSFDVPLLAAEFQRCGIQPWPQPGTAIVDSYIIFRKRENQTLSSAVRYYCSRELINAHSADADTEATLDVLLGQLAKYPDLPTAVQALHDYCQAPAHPDCVDMEGKFKWQGGKVVFTFGKFKGRPLDEVATELEGKKYLKWMIGGGAKFRDDVVGVAKEALHGRFPERPSWVVVEEGEEGEEEGEASNSSIVVG